MKFETGRNQLLGALQSVVNVVERRQTLPVLANVLLDAGQEELIITATDLELELVSRAEVRTVQPGKITIPARKFYDICRGLPEGADITVEASDGKAIVKSGRSRFTLSTVSASDFPQIGSADGGTEFSLPQKALKTLIEKTSFAMAAQDVRYYLNGLLLHVTAKRVRAVATDGHRLAMSEFEGDTGASEEMQVILPRKAVLELARLLDDSDEVVQLRAGDGQFQADLEAIRITSKLIDGRFPDYERVIPEGGENILSADRDRVKQALVRASILANEKFRGVRLMLDKGKLKLQTNNPEHEEAEEELDVDYNGTAMEIGFNVNYLLDALNASGGETFMLTLKSSDASGLLHASENASSKYVVMPMRL